MRPDATVALPVRRCPETTFSTSRNDVVETRLGGTRSGARVSQQERPTVVYASRHVVVGDPTELAERVRTR